MTTQIEGQAAKTGKRLTPADELRRDMEESEKLAVNIVGAGTERALELLHCLDSIQTRLPQLASTGIDLQAEQGRWLGVQGAVRRHGRQLQRELKPVGGLSSARSQLSAEPPPENWWWWIDVVDRRQRNRRLRNLALTAVAVIAVLLAARALLNYLYPVDPAVVEAMRLRSEAEAFLIDGNIAAAIASLEAARTVRPDDTDTLAWLTVVFAVTDRTAESDAARQRLIEVWDQANADASIAQKYVLLNRPQEGQRLAAAAIASNPDEPAGYFALGSALEAMNRYGEALDAYQTAGDVAERAGRFEMQAMARMQAGMLMQRGPALNTSPLTTPEP